MLRPHVQQEFLPSAGAGKTGLGAERLFFLLGDFAFGSFGRRFVQARNEFELAPPAAPFGREILSQGKPLRVIFRHQNAPKIRVTRKGDAHHVVDFALQEFGAFPDAGDRRDGRIVLGDSGLEAKATAVGEGMQVIHHLESLPILRVVHRTDIRKMVERSLRCVVKKRGQLNKMLGGHADRHLGSGRIRFDGQHRLGELFHQGFDQRLHGLISYKV